MKVINEGFRHVAPEEILQCRHTGANEKPASDDQPILSVEYLIAPSGQLYTGKDQTRGFVGISIVFQLALKAPGQTPQRYTVEVAPPQQFSVEFTYDGIGTKEPSGARV